MQPFTDDLQQIHIGRFAPSPTGKLHFGSLIAAVASYCSVKSHQNNKWLLRIEDIDTDREQKGASDSIINALEAYGFEWDDEITYQSQRTQYYQEAIDDLSTRSLVYPCSCTRKELKEFAGNSTYGYLYPGLCRNGVKNPEIIDPSIRLVTSNNEISFADECQEDHFTQNIQGDIGDFILKRRGGLFAYQLAVVVDDHLQGINQVVRGSDLFDNTPRQIYLQNLLGYKTPNYLHFPIAISSDEKKLSKQNGSPEISTNPSSIKDNLLLALTFLGQEPPPLSEFLHMQDIWLWTNKHWCNDKIPKIMNRVLETKTHV